MDSDSIFHAGLVHRPRFSNVITLQGPGWMIWLCCLMAWSCKETPGIPIEMLQGRWEIGKAERNGRETIYLRGGYFIMEKNGSMTMNLTGEEEKGPYSLEDRILRMNDTQEFIIEALVADSMRLRFTRGPNHEYLLHLYKKSHDQ